MPKFVDVPYRCHIDHTDGRPVVFVVVYNQRLKFTCNYHLGTTVDSVLSQVPRSKSKPKSVRVRRIAEREL